MQKRFSTRTVGGLVIGLALMTSTLTGCASGYRESERRAVTISRLEVQLRKAKAEIEMLRERNLVLKNRIKVVRENGGEDPATAPEILAGFKPGVEMNVPISPTVSRRVGRRQNVSAIP